LNINKIIFIIDYLKVTKFTEFLLFYDKKVEKIRKISTES